MNPPATVATVIVIAAPPATPLALRQRMDGILREITEDPTHAKAFAAMGLEAAYAPMEPFGKFMHSEVARWAKFVKEANIRLD